jgi:nucleoside-diphosphate-sugar epimerase
MKIVVTGSESFIGRVLVPLGLERGLEVVGIDTVAPSFSGGRVGDIRAPDVADLIPDGTDAIVHLAAISRDTDCRDNPRLAWDVNVMGTLNLIEAARARHVRQFVFASSEWVYGDVANDAAQDEDAAIDPTRNKSDYAATKITGEAMLRLAHARSAVAAATILRFGIVYGPRPANWSAVEALVNSVLSRDEVTVGSLATARRFIHVQDIAAGVVAALGRSGCEVFNLSGDELVPLHRVIGLAMELSGRRPTVTESNPAGISIRNPVNDRSRRALPWRQTIEIQAGIAALIAYFRSSARSPTA